MSIPYADWSKFDACLSGATVRIFHFLQASLYSHSLLLHLPQFPELFRVTLRLHRVCFSFHHFSHPLLANSTPASPFGGARVSGLHKLVNLFSFPPPSPPLELCRRPLLHRLFPVLENLAAVIPLHDSDRGDIYVAYVTTMLHYTLG